MADGSHLEKLTNVILMDIINSLLKTGNKTANINVKTAVYTHCKRRRIENRKNHKKAMLTTLNIDIQAMLVWLTLPFYDFCGFRSVAVNSVYKLQFISERDTYVHVRYMLSPVRLSVCRL